MHNGRQLSKYVRVCLWRVRVLPNCDFNCRQAKRPHIGRDSVCGQGILRLALNTFRLYERCQDHYESGRRGRKTHGHVALASDVCFSEGLLELPRYSEVTQFNLALLVDEHIRRLHIYWCKEGRMGTDHLLLA